MFHSTLGLVHIISALVAMLMGAVVIANPKMGAFHKRMGYGYVASMLILNGTAFQIFHLFGRFGPFHALAIISLLSLMGGMLPAINHRQIKNWLYWHYYFMSWSVVGLYAAFWAEVLTRTLPLGQFWPVVMAATGVTAGLGSYFIRRNASQLLPALK